MTDKQILSMIREEKQAYRTAKQLRRTDPQAARLELDHACDLTCRIDRAHHKEQEG